MVWGRWGGWSPPWPPLVRKVWGIFAVCQSISPVVAALAVFLSPHTGGITATSVDSVGGLGGPLGGPPHLEPQPLSSGGPTVVTVPGGVQAGQEQEHPSQCCPHAEPSESGHGSLKPCPLDSSGVGRAQMSRECGDPDRECSGLPAGCLQCHCDYSCTYGHWSAANCSVREGAHCQGDREGIRRKFLCSYCFLTNPMLHTCSTKDLGCRSVGSPTSHHHWYVANCTSGPDTLCLGKAVFSKRRECNWTEGYSWRTALILSITLGGFGADRFYLGHWQEGIGKLFSFGGLGVWTLVDVVLVSIGYIGPADGSLYI